MSQPLVNPSFLRGRFPSNRLRPSLPHYVHAVLSCLGSILSFHVHVGLQPKNPAPLNSSGNQQPNQISFVNKLLVSSVIALHSELRSASPRLAIVCSMRSCVRATLVTYRPSRTCAGVVTSKHVLTARFGKSAKHIPLVCHLGFSDASFYQKTDIRDTCLPEQHKPPLAINNIYPETSTCVFVCLYYISHI